MATHNIHDKQYKIIDAVDVNGKFVDVQEIHKNFLKRLSATIVGIAALFMAAMIIL